MNLPELPRSFYEHKTFMFLGAGAGICDRFPGRLRLPLGNDVMNKLLAARFPDVEETKRAEKFQTYSGSAPTPDSVWNTLVQQPSAMREYYSSLVELFGSEKPVPPSYYKFARWFLTAPNVAGAATTNFDERLDSALHSIASIAAKQSGRDYYIAALPDDFSYHSETKTPYNKILQKIHGTISRPWSIVAGYKCLATGKAATVSSRHKGVTSYDVLIDALRLANNWVFIGYSFSDPYLKDFLSKNVPSDHKHIYIVSPDVIVNHDISRFKQQIETGQLGRRSASMEFDLVSTSAENFFDHVLADHLKDDVAIVSLPEHEKSVLRDGPTHLGDCAGRFTCRGYSPSEPYMFPDPIYGDIVFARDLLPGVLHFIDTGEIQRLRYIKQLSFVHLKYPAAIHDRFSHTIGVTHLADRFLSGSRIEAMQKALDCSIDQQTRLALSVAAIMHDSGHGPLGHTLDSVKSSLGVNRPHELDSIKLLEVSSEQSVFADLDKAHSHTGIAKDDVLSILHGADPLSPLISNQGLDLDRLDFVLRDAFHATLSLPDLAAGGEKSTRVARLAAQIDAVLNSLTLVRVADPKCLPSGADQKKVTALVIKRSAYDIILDIAKLYSELYHEVYYCWQNACAQTMVGLGLEELLHSHKFSVPDVLRLTDMELFTALEEFENPRVRELAYLVKYRRLYDCIGIVYFDEKIRDADVRTILDVSRSCAIREGMPKSSRPLDGPFDILLAVRPPKEFVASFLETFEFGGPVSAGDIQKEVLATAPGRLFVFRWPGSEREVDMEAICNALRNEPRINLRSARLTAKHS